MTDLLARLEAAEAGSSWTTHDAEEFANIVHPYAPGWIDAYELALAALNGSIDAAKALIERALPGWEWMVEVRKGGWASATLHEFNVYEGRYIDAPTPALAMCIALIRAVEEKEARDA